MNAQPAVRRRLAATVLLVVASLACVDVQQRAPEKVATDSAGGTVAATAPTPVRGSFGADSAISVRGAAGPEEIVLALRNDTVHALDVVDSTPAAMPTDADLATLRREMIVPLAGVAATALYDSYGEVRGGTRQHEALDIPAPRGTPVLSSTNGRVLKLFNSKAGGLMVYATDSTEHFILMYGHLDAYQPGLADGQPLRRGQQIGIVGTTGNAAPNVPHLHFAVARSNDVTQWWKGAPVNPYPLLKP
jgi:murein DD-endopeptidase MepM/ murein hydrolase activator NlpD